MVWDIHINSVCKYSLVGILPRPFSYVCLRLLFQYDRQNGGAATESQWPKKLKLWTIWPTPGLTGLQYFLICLPYRVPAS